MDKKAQPLPSRLGPLATRTVWSKAWFCFLAPVSTYRLDALDPNAYEAFKASRNLQDVVERVLHNEQEVEKEPGRKRALSVQASLMTPVQPMLVSNTALPLPPTPLAPRPAWLVCRSWGKKSAGAREHFLLGHEGEGEDR